MSGEKEAPLAELLVRSESSSGRETLHNATRGLCQAAVCPGRFQLTAPTSVPVSLEYCAGLLGCGVRLAQGRYGYQWLPQQVSATRPTHARATFTDRLAEMSRAPATSTVVLRRQLRVALSA